MRTTIVPAQVTTIEDRIAGSLSLTQMLLLSVPMFGGTTAYIVLPPFNGLAAYKVMLAVTLLAIFGTLAIRVRGKLMLHWVAVVIRYSLRPQFYVYNKNSEYLRAVEPQEAATEAKPQVVNPDEKPAKKQIKEVVMTASDITRLEKLMANPNFSFSFKTNRKGKVGMYVAQRNQS